MGTAFGITAEPQPAAPTWSTPTAENPCPLPEGLTLRDLFACAAIGSFQLGLSASDSACANTADTAYKIADAMIKRRAQAG